METWKTLPFDDYNKWEVSNIGNIRHLKFKRNLKLKNNKGHLMVRLDNKGKSKWFLIHRLVAICFLDKPEGKDVVNHINGIKNDNRLENLEWCTTEENTNHYFLNTYTYKNNKKYFSLNKLKRIYKSKDWKSAEDFMKCIEEELINS